MPNALQLDPRLEADSDPLADLPLCTVRLMKDARYPWVLLVPKKAGLTEIIDLDEGERVQLMREIADVSLALKAATGCDKLNIGALGNIVSQLHVHVIARFKNDAAWPGPVWGVGQAVAWDQAKRRALIGKLLAALDT